MNPEDPTESAKPTSQMVDSSEAAIAAVSDLIRGATRRVAILSDEFTAAFYGDVRIVDAVQAFLLQHERTEVRVLVNQAQTAMRRGHRFVELGRRLSSRVHFRELPEDRRDVHDDLVLIDEAALWHRDSPAHFESRLYLHAPLEARLQLRRFNELWEFSSPAREFSTLGI